MITTRTTTHPFAQTLDRMGTLNRVLDQMLPDNLRAAAPAWVPALEVAERADAYLIAADLPGVREDQIELSLERRVLTVRAERAADVRESDHVFLAERPWGTMSREIVLGDTLDLDKVTASYDSGVLTVTIPVAAAAKSRRIEISNAPVSTTSAVGGGSAPAPDEAADATSAS